MFSPAMYKKAIQPHSSSLSVVSTARDGVQPVQQPVPDTSAEVAAVREALAAVSPAAQKAAASFLAEAGRSLSLLRQERSALALDAHHAQALQVSAVQRFQTGRRGGGREGGLL